MAAQFGTLVDLAGNRDSSYLYALDLSASHHLIRRISTATGQVDTIVSDGLLRPAAGRAPTDIEVDGQGRVYVAVGLDAAHLGIVRYPPAGGPGEVVVSGICCGFFGGADDPGWPGWVGDAFAIDPLDGYIYYNHSKPLGETARQSWMFRASLNGGLPIDAGTGELYGGHGGFARGIVDEMRFGPDGNLYVIQDHQLVRWSGPDSYEDLGDTRAIPDFPHAGSPLAFADASASLYGFCWFGCSSPTDGKYQLIRRGGFGQGSLGAGFPPVPATSIVGSTSGYADGSPGKLDQPVGLVVARDGSMAWIADKENHRIRQVALPMDPGVAEFKRASENAGPNPALRNQEPAQSCVGDPIDTRTGNLSLRVPCVEVPGRGPGLRVRVGYNSLAASARGWSSSGWSTTLDMRLVVFDSSATVVQETGSTVSFTPGAGGSWEVPARFSASLVENADGTFTFTRRHFEVFRFDAAGRLLSVGDLDGNTTTFHRPVGSDLVDYIEDAAGRRLHVAWLGGRLRSITDEYAGAGGPRSAVFTWDAAGDLVDYQDPAGGLWVFTYDGSHRMRTIRKPGQVDPSKVVENHYDEFGRVDWQEDELGRRTTLDYDAVPTLSPVAGSELSATAIVLPDGTVQLDEFVDGRRERTTMGYGSAAPARVTYTFDPDTLALATVTDDAGLTTTLTSDAGNVTSVTDPTGRITRWAYNALDQVTQVQVGETTTSVAAVVTSTNSYDATGHLLASTAAVGTSDAATTTFVHGDAAHPEDVTSIIDARGKTWAFTYDPGTGDQLTVTDPLGHATSTTYNDVGWPVAVTSPKGTATPIVGDFTTSIEYDLAARSTTVTGPTGDTSRTVVDPAGRPVSVASGITAANPTGDVTTFGYTAAGELETIDAPGPGTKSYDYTPRGQVEGYTDEAGGHTGYTYDPAGRLETLTDPSGGITRYAYDPAGRPTSMTQPVPGATCTGTKIGCVTVAFDDAGRVTGIDYSDPATPDLSAIGYDELGRRTATTTGTHAESWGYDHRSRVRTHTDVNGRTTTYAWDETGNLTGITYPGQTTPVSYVFDDAGRMVSLSDWAGRTTGFAFDDNGNWASTTFPSGTSNVDTFGYDQADRLTSVTWRRGSTVLGSETYARPLKGMVDTITPTGAAGSVVTDFGYDERDRLASANTSVWSYDPVSNLTRRPDGTLQVFDPAQRLCWTSPTATTGTCDAPAADATRFSYDTRGNRTDAVLPSGTTTTYGYDQANRLSTVGVPTAWADGSNQFQSLDASARVLDTTVPTGACTPSPCGRLAPGSPVSVQVTGTGGVPSSGVKAVTGTITVSGATADGWLDLDPVGDAAAATVAVQTGSIASSSFTGTVDANGRITLGADVGVDVQVDITGFYFAPSFVTATNFWPTTPRVLADTRSATATGTCNSTTPCTQLPAGTSTVRVAGEAGVPATGVTAVAVTLVVTNPAGPGTLRLAPNGAASAGTATWDADFPVAAITATVPVDANGDLQLELSTPADVTVNVAGWWRATTSEDLGTSLELLPAPQRLVDTRPGTATGICDGGTCESLTAYAAPTSVTVAGHAGLPADTAAVALSISTIDPASTGLLTVSTPGGGAAGVVVYEAHQEVSASMIVPVDPATGTIEVSSWADTNITIDVIGAFARPTDTWAYTYDSAGLRSSKAKNTQAPTTFTWTAAGGLPLLLSEHRSDGTSRIVYGPGGTPLYQVTAVGTPIYFHTDQLGSVRLVTNTNGTTRGTLTYDPYGKTLTNTNPWVAEQPLLQYNGQYLDTETGLIYLRARYYDPSTAQFLTRDPLVSLTNEPYGYTGGNPVNGADPSGLDWRNPATWTIVDRAQEELEDACIEPLNPEGCDSIAELHPRQAQQATDFAGGVLVANPITAPLNLDLEGHGVNTNAFHFHAGRWEMIALSTGFGLLGGGGPNAFNIGASTMDALATCVGLSGGDCSQTGLVAAFSWASLSGGWIDVDYLTWGMSIMGGLLSGIECS